MFKKSLFKTIIIGAFLFLLAPNPARAQSSGRFYFSPSNTELIEGCQNTVQVRMDTGGKASNAADIKIYFNPSEIELIDQNGGEAGIQIGTGSVFQNYFGNQVNFDEGYILLAGASFESTFTGDGVFAIIKFRGKAGVTSTEFSIDFQYVGDTLDSNIAESGTNADLLASTGNAYYTFKEGNCFGDEVPPIIDFIYPRDKMTDVPKDSDVRVTITDEKSGVDLNTVVVTVNGKGYQLNDNGFSYYGSPLEYFVVIDHEDYFPTNQASTVRVDASDYAQNSTFGTISFNKPSDEELVLCGDSCEQDGDCPYNHMCDRGICKIPSCVGRDDCTCTPVRVELPETGECEECPTGWKALLTKENMCLLSIPLLLIIIITLINMYLVMRRMKKRQEEET